ncbi:hypothetical protein NEMIN01_1958 [Nematocida minor]|uniref:uncharacterized protein n=1 Tax=Nematocida minor TaxID=1912983 RepID=UPI002220719A|nr:uncharacterized protein NEMIN01_1958 [Nematocida minor]KAI5192344.1 hypothetical protein NEMIN01_1958 [Nematocida minor]
MKNWKIRKLLDVVSIAHVFFIEKCGGSRNALSYGDIAVEKKGLDLDWFVPDMRGSNIWNLSKSIEEFRDTYTLPLLPTEENAASAILSTCIKTNNGAKPNIGEKRRAESTSDSDASNSQPARKNRKKEVAQNQHPQMPKSPSKKGEKIENFNIKLWNTIRLTNKRRSNYNTHHQTVYRFNFYNFCDYMAYEIMKDSYQQKIRKSIKNFSEKIAFLIERNALWCFIAGRSTNVITKNKDLLGLQSLFKDEKDACRKLVEGFKGYYPGVFKDMLAYMEKHKPLRAIKSFPTTVWDEKLGDIYMRKNLDLNYGVLEDQKKISQIDEKYSALAYAVHMVLALPEMHQDFFWVGIDHIQNSKIFQDSFRNKQAQQVLLSLCTLAREPSDDPTKKENEYKNIHIALQNVYAKDAQHKPTVFELYRDIYMILADFYENAAVFDSKSYVLLGKCVIKHQRYVRYEMIYGFEPDSSSIQNYGYTYSFEIDRWDVSPDVKPHYHVFYVDNTMHQLRRVCMPIYKKDGSNEEHYLHTVDGIVEYIKKLYEIETDIVHPFKVRKRTKEWSYIRKDERKLTAKELAAYELVFYRIDEDLEKTKFTFAEFRPFIQQSKNTIRIPLFLTRLMVDAVDLGPFVKENAHAEIDAEIELDRMVPNVYTFDSKYKKKEYSNLHKYYSNLYILPDEEKRENLDCYIMDYQASEEGKIIKAAWSVDITKGVNVYTHCAPSEKFRGKENLGKLNHFINVIGSRKHRNDSTLQGIWLRNNNTGDRKTKSQAEKIYTWIVKDQGDKIKKDKDEVMEKIREADKKFREADERYRKASEKLDALKISGNKKEIAEEAGEKKAASDAKSYMKRSLEALSKELDEAVSEKPDKHVELIVFQNVNSSKSSLGAHNEVLDVLISRYNQ